MMLPPPPATRREFFAPRLALSAIFLALLIGVTRFVWYPGLSFVLSGVPTLILVIAGVTMVIGPGLSTFLYRPGKKGLLGDLLVTLAVELIAIGLAANVLYDRRPYFAVFSVDRFELIAEAEVSGKPFQVASLRDKPAHAPRLVYAALPQDTDAHNALIDDVVFGGGEDIDRRPEFWLPYASGVAAVRERSKPLATLIAGGGRRAHVVRRWVDGQAGTIDDYVFVPVRGKKKDGAMVLHRDIGYPVAMLDADPW